MKRYFKILVIGAVFVLGGILSLARAESSRNTMLSIVFSNDTDGYLEPCGCGGENSGGLARRASAIADLRQSSQPILLLDSGNLGRSHSQYPILLSLMKQMGYAAVNVGRREQSFLPEYGKLCQQLDFPALGLLETPTSGVQSFLITELNHVKIGVIGLPPIDPGQDPHTIQSHQLNQIGELRKRVDLLILLSQQKKSDDIALLRAAEKTAPDLLIGGIDWSTEPEMIQIAKTQVAPTSTKGRSLGVVEVNLLPDSKRSYRFKSVVITPRLNLDAKIDRQIKQFYQSQVIHTPQELTASAPDLQCESCHSKQYNAWSKTHHAHAVQTLKNAGKLMPECLDCHSASYRSSRRLNLSNSSGNGIDCTTCHEISPDHAQNPRNTTQTIRRESRCICCHNHDRSPRFDFNRYWARLIH